MKKCYAGQILFTENIYGEEIKEGVTGRTRPIEFMGKIGKSCIFFFARPKRRGSGTGPYLLLSLILKMFRIYIFMACLSHGPPTV